MCQGPVATLVVFQCGYDAGNRVNHEFRALDGKGDAYWYDGLGRLTKTTKDSVDPTAELASGGTGATAHAFRRQFTLDGDSHRTQVVTTPMTGAAETTNYSTHGTRHLPAAGRQQHGHLVDQGRLRARPDKDRMRRVDLVQPQRPSWSSSQGGALSESGIQ
jgi:hypothetical protein